MIRKPIIYLKLCALAAAALSLPSCTDPPASTTGALALEAWIDNDGFPVAILTESLVPGNSDIDVSEAMAQWALVKITNGTDTVVMTGAVDYSVFPPYSYRNFTMRGVTGCTYTIIADYHNKQVRATSRILPSPTITEVRLNANEQAKGSYSASVAFEFQSDSSPACFVIYTQVLNSDVRQYPSMMGAISAAPGQQKIEAPLTRGSNMFDDYDANFHAGDSIDVIVARVDENVYRFWHGYNDVVYFGNNVFLSTSSSLPSNVEGGYGVFSARGVSHKIVVVPH